jgi:hypothetical protein
VPLTISRYARPGQFKVEVDVTDDAHNSAWYSNGTVAWADHVLPAPAGVFTFTVQNSGEVDSAPPTLASISITPDPLTVGSGSGTTYAELHITDPLAGLGGGSISLFNPSGFDQNIHFQDTQRISGNAQDGVYRVPLTLPAGAPTGTWHVEVGFDDLLGNYTRYDSVNMPGGASAAEFEVVSSSGGTYDDWALTYFSYAELQTIGALGEDPDGDGVPNGVEAVMGGHPRDAGNAPRSEGEVSAVGGSHLVIRFNRAQNLPDDLRIVIQAGPGLDPADWTGLVTKSGTTPWTGSGVVEEGTPSGGIIPVTVHAPPGAGPCQFMRVRVDRISGP